MGKIKKKKSKKVIPKLQCSDLENSIDTNLRNSGNSAAGYSNFMEIEDENSKIDVEFTTTENENGGTSCLKAPLMGRRLENNEVAIVQEGDSDAETDFTEIIPVRNESILRSSREIPVVQKADLGYLKDFPVLSKASSSKRNVQVVQQLRFEGNEFCNSDPNVSLIAAAIGLDDAINGMKYTKEKDLVQKTTTSPSSNGAQQVYVEMPESAAGNNKSNLAPDITVLAAGIGLGTATDVIFNTKEKIQVQQSHVSAKPIDAHNVFDKKPDHDPMPKNSYRSLFLDNRKLGNGLKLQDYKQLRKAKKVVLEEGDIDKIQDVWGNALIGYVAGKSIGKGAIIAQCNSWKVKYKLTFDATGWIVISFDKESDKERILMNGPYMIYGRPLIVKDMPPFFRFDEDEISIVPLWIRLPHLPKQLWNENALAKIVSNVGKPLQTDNITKTKEGHAFARALVEIDLADDIIDEICIELPGDEVVIQVVHYEFIPRYCGLCKAIGHNKDNCLKNSPKVMNDANEQSLKAPVHNINGVKNHEKMTCEQIPCAAAPKKGQISKKADDNNSKKGPDLVDQNSQATAASRALKQQQQKGPVGPSKCDVAAGVVNGKEANRAEINKATMGADVAAVNIDKGADKNLGCTSKKATNRGPSALVGKGEISKAANNLKTRGRSVSRKESTKVWVGKSISPIPKFDKSFEKHADIDIPWPDDEEEEGDWIQVNVKHKGLGLAKPKL